MKDYQKKIQGKGEVNMSLYEINQGIMGQLPAYDGEKIKKLEESISNWSINEKLQLNRFFMLLCRDINYYTLFYLNPEESDFRDLGEGVTYLLIEAGYTIHSEEECDDHYELWVKKDNETHAFMLFPYDQGVVHYG